MSESCVCVAAGRISYLYGLNGPSMAIDTACSSSLVALGTARNALLLGVSAEALASGITLMLSPTTMAMYAVAGDTPCRSHVFTSYGVLSGCKPIFHSELHC